MKLRILLLCLLLLSVSFSRITEIQWQEVKEVYRISQENTADVRAKFDLAMVYAYTGFLQEGFHELDVINKMDPEFHKNILIETAQVVSTDPLSWKSNFYYAFALYFNNRKDEARDYFYKVFELTNEKSVKGWSLGYIAYIYGEQSQWRTALKIIDQAIRNEPDGMGLFLAKAYGQQKVGDFFGVTGTLFQIGAMQASGMFNKYNINNLKNEK